MATRFILIRHGTTDWNMSKRYQGHTDIPLNTEGRKQAQELSQMLKDIPVDIIYTSDLSRANETAEIIAKGRNIPVHRMNSLRETHFGQWEGLTIDEIHERFPQDVERLKKDPLYGERPGGESRYKMYQRVKKTIEKIIIDHPDQSIAVVSHQGALAAAVCALTDEDYNIGRKKYRLGNTSFHILERDKEKWHISHMGTQEELPFKA